MLINFNLKAHRFIRRMVLFVFVFVFIQCTFQNKGPVSNSESVREIDQRTATVADIRAELARIPYSPGGKGFSYMKIHSETDVIEWARKNRPRIEWALQQLPEGFGIQITGHTCNIGTRQLNMPYSYARAFGVYQALKKQGFSMKRFSYKGVAYDELLSDYDANSQQQRRVTLKVIMR